MSKAATRRRWEWSALGLFLCLLAALFAIEAKIAWYGPEGAPATQISSSKLQPADAPRLAANALAASLTAVTFPKIVVILALMTSVTGYVWALADADQIRVVSYSFSPQVSFRPPPSL